MLPLCVLSIWGCQAAPPSGPTALAPGPLGLGTASLDSKIALPPPAFEAPAFAVPSVAPAAPATACNEQPPQDFLIRGNYVPTLQSSPADVARRRALHDRAVEYRTREYGYVEDFGEERWNPIPPEDTLYTGSFFGLRVRMNNRVLSALQCVETAIQQTCDDAYRPQVAEGFRAENKFHNDEISNHAYGIAIDLDFHLNPCCGCVAKISDRPLCKTEASAYERTVVPRCWIDAFERFGFYWLGHDALEDTMHFEFLGDPDRILAESEEQKR